MERRSFLSRLAHTLSIIVAFTSLMDLFVNRLLFRAGPEVLTHMVIPGLSELAIAGRISFTFEQVALYVILGSAAILFSRELDSLARCLALLILPQLFCAVLLYLPIPLSFAWGLSMLLVLVTAIEVTLLVIRASRKETMVGKKAMTKRVFLLGLGIYFVLALYYRVSLLFGAISATTLPLEVDAYYAAVFMIMFTAIAALAYAFVVPSSGFKMNIWNFTKAAALPTLIVGPILYGLMQSYFVVQIFSLVIAMSTDITLSFELVRVIAFLWWVLLVAIALLFLKGRASKNRFVIQQGIGLILILSTTLLFNYPNYLLLGTTGILLITYPLTNPIGT